MRKELIIIKQTPRKDASSFPRRSIFLPPRSRDEWLEMLQRDKFEFNAQKGIEFDYKQEYLDLSGLHFEEWVKLDGINFNFVDLNAAHLPKAFFTDAEMEKVILRDATFENGDASYAEMRRADLRNASLIKTNFTGARLLGADLSGANLSNSRLNHCLLHKAKFLGTNLTNTRLTRADLRETDFSDANLTNASLQDADLRYANLTGANLEGVNLSGAATYGAIGIPEEIQSDLLTKLQRSWR